MHCASFPGYFRKRLVEQKKLYVVVKLPSVVLRAHAGVSTAILFTRTYSGGTDEV
ncbi:MAG: hypothetical protein IPO89_15835 [Actinomycetales bacterium]|nr:hypothetical protein [Candidatus Lutibacillus vidarii]